jgi:hypothetical protein
MRKEPPFAVCMRLNSYSSKNFALKLALEHREVQIWQNLLARLLTDKEMLAGVRLKFSDTYKESKGRVGLEWFLGDIPPQKPN